MPEQPTQPTQPEENKKKRKSPGLIDRAILDGVKVAEDCRRIVAEDAAIRAAVEERGWESQAGLTESLKRCNAAIDDIKAKRTTKQTRTSEEVVARKALLIAFNPIIIAARDKYAKGSAERTAYGHGADLDAAATSELIALAKYIASQLIAEAPHAPKDNLPGLKQAEIQAVATLYNQYKDADWAQVKAQRSAEEALIALESEVTGTLAPLRRKLQNRAELAYPHTNPANAATRKLFHLPPLKRATD